MNTTHIAKIWLPALLAAVLVAAACGTEGDAGAGGPNVSTPPTTTPTTIPPTTVPPTTPPVDDPKPVTPTTVSPETTEERRAEYEAALDRWAANGPAAYTLAYEVLCFCVEDVRGPFRLTVEEGAVVQAERETDGTFVTVDPSGNPALGPTTRYTAEALFGLVEQAIDESAATIRVTYDDDTGLPVELWIDFDERLADEEIGVIVSEFVPA
jgi:hypothetical protein